MKTNKKYPLLMNAFNKKDLDSAIKGIAIVQAAQVRGECPKGHKLCLKPKCWMGVI